MKKSWYECKVKYRETSDTGDRKVVTRPFLVDAVSFTDAETIITEKMKENISEEFKVADIKAANYAEVHGFDIEDPRWFKAKVNLIAYDEESGRERKTTLNLLIAAYDVKHAYDNTMFVMKDTMGEFAIPAIAETAIVEVFEYVSAEDSESDSEMLDYIASGDSIVDDLELTE